jgi:hypothetical protein
MINFTKEEKFIINLVIDQFLTDEKINLALIHRQLNIKENRIRYVFKKFKVELGKLLK